MRPMQIYILHPAIALLSSVRYQIPLSITMLSIRPILLIISVIYAGLSSVDGLSASAPNTQQHIKQISSRRAFLSTSTAIAFLGLQPIVANARYILNEETGEYDEVTDDDWKNTWSKRLDKAKTMSNEDIFLAAQGAGNQDLREGEESEASKKRRAFAGCRNDALRAKGGMKNEKECAKRILGGDYQFMIDAM